MVKPETGQAEFRGEDRALAGVGVLRDREAVREIERGLQGIREAVAEALAHHQPVHHHFDVVLELLVERRHRVDLQHLAVDLDALEAALLEVRQLLAVLALAPAHHRRQQVEPGSVFHREDAVDHLRDGLALDRQARGGRVGDADPREQQAHIVVDLGHRAHGRPGVARGGLLLDRDGRREALDGIDVRLLHQLQELPGVGRQALDIAALPLGIDRVEGEGRFARARQPRQHDQAVAGHVDIDVLEVVLARAANPDELHGPLRPERWSGSIPAPARGKRL